MPDTAQNAIHSPLSELRVSGHTMTLDPGLYCIFSVPEGPAPDTETGLPVVRIGPAPGRLAGEIELLGLDPDGWIGPDAATLVRVKQSRSNLLVTVYQAADSGADAPQFQVVRLSGSASAPQSAEPTRQAPAPGQAEPAQSQGQPEPVEVVAHVYGRGDVGAHLGLWAGEPGSKRWIEGFGISGIGTVPDTDVEYQAVLGRGWLSPWSAGGQFCGSRGMSLPILGLRVRLLGASAATHRVVLTASFVDGSKVGPVGGGEACESPTLAALEAFQLAIEPNAAVASAPTERPAADTPEPRRPVVKPLVKPVVKPVVKPAVKRDVKLAKAKASVEKPPVPVVANNASARRR